MIKPEVTFGLDNFGKQKTLSLSETIGQLVLDILLLKPGQLPSLPHIGMNIKQYIYKFQEDIDPEYIKSQLQTQCRDLSMYIDTQSFQIVVFPLDTESILFISVKLTSIVDEVPKDLLIGFKKVKNSEKVTFNYKITDTIL